MKMSEAANLVFQWIFVLNAVKHKLFYVSIVKEILRADPKLWGCTIFGPKMVHLPRTKMFWEKALIFSFISLLGPFTVHKILKKFLERIQSYDDAPFLGPKLPIYSKQGFFWKSQYYLHIPIRNSHGGSRVIKLCHFWVQNGPFAQRRIFWEKSLILFSYTYKKFSQRIKSYKNVPLLGAKWPICQMKNFFQKTR